MEGDRSWIYRRTMPGVMGISSEFQLGVKCDVQTRISNEFSMWFREDVNGKKSVNASNSECLKCSIWGTSKRFIHKKEVPIVLHITVVYGLKEAEEFQSESPPGTSPSPMASTMVETSTPPAATSIPTGTSTPPAAASTPPQSDCAKVITKIMKAHFVEAHPCFGKSSGKTGYRGVVTRGSTSTTVVGEDGRGLRTVETVCPTISVEGTAKYRELKANAKRLHIETGSPILTVEQLMFKAVDGNNEGHVFGLESQSAVVTIERQIGNSSSSVPSASFAAVHKACIERERRLWG
ncbi:hypothetical protein M9H77_31347 [Catharanthus roseus]|uniref:Uncharacterized protein n=1 Tax=Catharanthus roseus TaxID=4058 RepID=A0ACB9ZZU2_CATRO|nr:hypothetical protein M9H77_31347 [Catharanthus roseus]